jgi:tetratricopeptide (TPR) repeat protein
MLSGCASYFARRADLELFKQAVNLQRNGPRGQTLALAIYRSLDGVERGYPGVLNNMGVIYAKQGRMDQAEVKLSQAAVMDPDSVTIWNNLGVARLLDGRPEDARAALELVEPTGDRLLQHAVSATGQRDWDNRYRRLQEHVQRAVARAKRCLARIEEEKPRQAVRVADLERDLETVRVADVRRERQSVF